jgi:gliding motility-associated-like protein
MKNRLLICLFLFLSFKVYSQSCTLSVTIASSSPTICTGYSVTLKATASQGTPPYSYIWSTGETTSSINVNKSGTYTVTVSDNTSGCSPVKQSITVGATTTPNPPTAKNVIVCPNTTATLTATAPGGTYQWYDAATAGNYLATGPSYTTPAITANTVYYVQTTVNTCTSTRTPVYVDLPARPTVIGDTVCQGNVATLTARGGTSYDWYDSASGGTPVSTDSSYTTPPLTTSKTYYVVVNENGCSSAYTPVTATVSPAPSAPAASNVTICSGTNAQLHATASTGIFDWFTVPSGGTSLISSPDYTTPVLTATTTYYVQTSLNECTSQRVPVTVTVDAPPAPPAAQTDSICYNSSATLTAGADPSATYQWYDAPVNGNLLATGNTYITPVLTNSTAYFVQAVNGSCTTTRSQVNVIVKPQLSAPTASGAIICSGSTATLTTKSQGGIYQWYNAATGGTLLVTDTTYTTPALTTTTTYYVQRTFEGCVSPRTAVQVTVEPPDAAPAVSNTAVCEGNSATLTITSSDNIYAWYDAPSGGNLLSTAQVYVTPALTATTTYYVQTTSSTGCNSPLTPVTVNVNPTPAQPAASGATICPGTSARLTVSTASGTIQWYNADTNGMLLATGDTYNTPPLNTPTTYYVQSTNGTCNSARTAVTVSLVTGTNPEFQYSSGTYCASGPNTKPVINNPSGGTFSASPSGLVFVSNTTGEINMAATTPGTYTVSFTNNAPCPGTTSVTLSIVNTLNSTFYYNSPFCQNGANPSPLFNGGSSGGTFTATPAGLVFVNTSTGEIDLSKSTPGTYKITNTINSTGSCSATSSSTTITIDPEIIVSAGPDQTLPGGSTVQLAGSISGGTTSGTWTGGTGTFSNPNNPKAVYTPGPGETTATLTLTSGDPPGPCGPESSSVTITFHSQPNAPTAAGATICSGTSAYLSATAPGGTYRWYDAATNGNLLNTGPTFTTPILTANTIYYVETTVNGVTSNRTAANVTVVASTASPTISGSTEICQGSSTTLTASGSAGTYEWYNAPAGGNLLSAKSAYTTPVLNYNANYYVEAKVNSCKSARTEVDVKVTTMPNVTSAATGVICSGNPLNYTITADDSAATFSWSRAKITGISNVAVTNQTTSTINETLINTSNGIVKVTYNITPFNGTCAGPVFNYVVTVYPAPAVTSADSTTTCDQTATDYTIKFNITGTTSTWSRPVVAGISNTAVSGQSASTIKEVLFNTTGAPIKVNYVFNYQTAACTGAPFNFAVTVNPLATITSDATGTACSGIPQNYVITSNVPSATYSWSRAAVSNISNPAVTGQTSSSITENLVNKATYAVNVTYIITPSAYGCTGTPFNYVVAVNPSVATPVPSSNSPVCVGTAIMLSTPAVIGATYQWTAPNGNILTGRDPEINNAQVSNSGTYTLVETVNGCQSTPATVNVAVNDQALANTNMPRIVVCRYNPTLQLNGTVTVGSAAGTGLWSGGSGTFSPARNVLNPIYTFSAADLQQDSIVLTLTSTSTDNCPASVSTETIVFGAIPGVSAGPDQEVCSQETSIPLSGRLFATGTVKWTGGSGNFSPSPDSLNTNYIPDAADISAGSVKLYLNLIGSTQCYFPQDSMTIKFIPPAKVNAGGIRYVLKGYTIQLDPTVNEDSLHYKWSPDIDINNDTLKNPTVTGDINRTYTVTVTDKRGCIRSDTVYVEVSPNIKIDNAFTPNGDGINDQWVITGLVAYVNATVDIYTRYGQSVFHSVGYPIPWDGTYNGKALPVGVYYYVIHLNLNNQVLSGYVTLLR